MKVAHKLALTLVLGVAIVMAADAYVRVQREIALFEADQARDQDNEARLLASVVGAAWRSGDEEAARRIVKETRRSRSDLNLVWVPLDALGRPGGRLRLSEANRQALLAGHKVTVVATDAGGTERRAIYVPLAVAGARPVALEISEAVSPPPWFINLSVIENAVATALIVTLCGGLAIILVSWFVGRPIEQLEAKARRIGTGDFTGRLDFSQHDEVGRLASEIDGMCDRLAAAQERVAAETEARIAALEQLRHADRLKTVGQLASGVAHELGTPLNVISGRASMIAAGGSSAADVTTCWRIIMEQADRMTVIIRQLLDFSRRRQPRVGAGNVARIAGQALEMVQPLAAQRRVQTALEAAAEPLADVDQSQILQALTNLMVNGIQAMTTGGRLVVRVDRTVTRPPADHGGPPGEYVRVQVEDEGEGIAPDALPHIFEPFFTTKDVGEGTGLGLSVTYGIVHDHRGWLEVESVQGKGTRFSIFLEPARGAPATRAGAPG